MLEIGLGLELDRTWLLDQVRKAQWFGLTIQMRGAPRGPSSLQRADPDPMPLRATPNRARRGNHRLNEGGIRMTFVS
jgi:hypothetical protein